MTTGVGGRSQVQGHSGEEEAENWRGQHARRGIPVAAEVSHDDGRVEGRGGLPSG